MGKKILMLCVCFLVAVSQIAFGRNFNFGSGVNIDLDGEYNYVAKFRTEEPASELVDLSSGNSNFEKFDMVNDRGTALIKMMVNGSFWTLYTKAEAFYDTVYNDDEIYNQETIEHAGAKIDLPEYYFELRYRTLTFRVGKQIVMWGDSFQPIMAVGVNCVSMYNGTRAGSPFYDPRDWQEPALMAWGSYEATELVSIEAAYSVDFDPRKKFPVVGTFGSFLDVFGYGADSTLDLRRPEEMEDMQQYGFSIRKTFPAFNDFELGLYYFHHFDTVGIMTLDFFSTTPQTPFVTFDEIDMFGLSFTQAVDAFDLFLQVAGEIAYRPNDAIQKNKILTQEDAELLNMSALLEGDSSNPYSAGQTFFMDSVGGGESGETLSWGLNTQRLFSDALPFLPWSFNFTPLFEIYGKFILDYQDGLYTNPQNTMYYTAVLPFSTTEMFDNFKMDYLFKVNGNLHKEANSSHTLGLSIIAKYGNSIVGQLGYNVNIGDPDESAISTTDRDSLTFKAAYYF